MSDDIVGKLLVTSVSLEPWVWDKPREEFEQALKKELEYASIDLVHFALDKYDQRKTENEANKAPKRIAGESGDIPRISDR